MFSLAFCAGINKYNLCDCIYKIWLAVSFHKCSAERKLFWRFKKQSFADDLKKKCS